jgi:hypothetical protein
MKIFTRLRNFWKFPKINLEKLHSKFSIKIALVIEKLSLHSISMSPTNRVKVLSCGMRVRINVENQKNMKFAFIGATHQGPQGKTGQQKNGLRSAPRNNKTSRLLTRPRWTFKSSARCLTPLIVKLQYAG